MSKIAAGHLQAGFIFGDITAGEYVYLPGSEVGTDTPMCVFESPKGRQDITIDEAVEIIARLSLKPVKHPILGERV